MKIPAIATFLALSAACGGVTTGQMDAAQSEADADVAGGDAGSSVDAAPLGPPLRVFTSSVTFSANFGGLAGADGECQTRADRGGVVGTFVAVLANTTTTLEQKLTVTGPVTDLIGTVLAPNPTAFFAGQLDGANALTESENPIPTGSLAWLGTNASNCGDWTEAVANRSGGATDVTATRWTESIQFNVCTELLRIQCIEQL